MQVALATRTEFAEILESFAEKVIQLPGVSRTRPHIFAEAKSDLRAEMRRLAVEYRDTAALPSTTATARVAAIEPGIRLVGRRQVCVERRARRT